MSTIDGDLFVSLDDLYRFMEWVIEVSGPDGEILFGGALRLIRENFADATPAPAHPGGERPRCIECSEPLEQLPDGRVRQCIECLADSVTAPLSAIEQLIWWAGAYSEGVLDRDAPDPGELAEAAHAELTKCLDRIREAHAVIEQYDAPGGERPAGEWTAVDLLADLNDRAERAMVELEKRAAAYGSSTERTRLLGKLSGLALVADWLRSYTPPTPVEEA